MASVRTVTNNPLLPVDKIRDVNDYEKEKGDSQLIGVWSRKSRVSAGGPDDKIQIVYKKAEGGSDAEFFMEVIE